MYFRFDETGDWQIGIHYMERYNAGVFKTGYLKIINIYFLKWYLQITL